MNAPLRNALATLFAALALGNTAHAAPEAPAAVQGVYVGTLGDGKVVLMSLHADGAALSGSYHFELEGQGWTQDDLSLVGTAGHGTRIELRETLTSPKGRQVRTGRLIGAASADGSSIAGTWKSADGRRKLPFTLTRAATWTTQAVVADGGIRSCERPRFADDRYAPLNRELAEACDYFLADGRAGAGQLRLEIDSLGRYVVAAVAYASSGGRELPPETIAVDLGAEEGLAAAQASQAQPRVTAVATRP